MKKYILIVILLVLPLISITIEASFSLSYQLNQQREIPEFDLKIDKERLSIPEFHVRGIYVNGWVAGTPERMNDLIRLVENSVLNTMVIDIKDQVGYISYNSQVELAREIGANRYKIKDIKGLLNTLHTKGIYTIGRIVVFKDALLARKRLDLALCLVNADSGELVVSDSWVDPSQKEIWEYILELTREAVVLGFDEIQLDYIRYPALATSPWQVVMDNEKSKSQNIKEFATYIRKEISHLGVPLSIDVFGLTTSANNDLGIGQNFGELANIIDIISPMVYPSHYAKGSFGIKIPEIEPYNVIYRSLGDARKKVGNRNNVIIRPWLQDFSLQYQYSSKEVIDQIKATESLGIKEWLLWNSKSRYTEETFINPPSP